ncbi:Chromate resistance protein ChrB [Rhodococcus sp. PvP104]|uniref:Chromate resistance protein ChrB n=1 Tax=Rhodococcus sp. PvP104 TaxID=2817911 RepID=UPI001AE44209|nr:Chromate resistance protein ChrB [Rhodococcus sp. PvP104]MBP2527280.1 vacuolar-type H+-ATPase subunit I/STV1 [Rhodococcus sp. PvP104]
MLVTNGEVTWIVLVVRLPTGPDVPSRHRVAVWRELRGIGALSLGQGTWTVPDVAAFAHGLSRVEDLVHRGGGGIVTLTATGRADTDAGRLRELFNAERAEEWSEFIADCGKFDAEIDKEIGKHKFTLAELEEEEQSLERLRRWYRVLKARDLFEVPGAATANTHLEHCAQRLAEYTDLVFTELHQL